MDTDKTRTHGGARARAVGYVVLPMIIVSCLVYAFVIDQRGKNLVALAAAFVAFVGVLFLAQAGKRRDAGSLFSRNGAEEINAASGRLMNGPHVDTAGNFRGFGRHRD